MPARKKPAGTKQDRRPQRREVGATLELLKGNQVADAIVPAAPADLEDESVDLWDAYWLSSLAKVALDVDRLGVARRWIEAVDERARAMRAFKSERLVKGSMGQATLNPLASWIKSREDVIAKCEAELGLTPYARQRLGIAVGQAQITAQQLNQMMTEGPAHAGDQAHVIDAEILGEFEEAE